MDFSVVQLLGSFGQFVVGTISDANVNGFVIRQSDTKNKGDSRNLIGIACEFTSCF